MTDEEKERAAFGEATKGLNGIPWGLFSPTCKTCGKPLKVDADACSERCAEKQLPF